MRGFYRCMVSLTSVPHDQQINQRHDLLLLLLLLTFDINRWCLAGLCELRHADIKEYEEDFALSLEHLRKSEPDFLPLILLIWEIF